MRRACGVASNPAAIVAQEECRCSAPNRGLLSHSMRTVGNDAAAGLRSREASNFSPLTFVPGRGIFRHT